VTDCPTKLPAFFLLCKHRNLSLLTSFNSLSSLTPLLRIIIIMAPSLEAPDAVEDVLSNPLKAAPKLVAPEPEHCPGPESETAGKADSCAGCPNQAICASAPKGPDPDIPAITARLAGIKHKVLVLSGKGGVGMLLFLFLILLLKKSQVLRPSDFLVEQILTPNFPREKHVYVITRTRLRYESR